MKNKYIILYVLMCILLSLGFVTVFKIDNERLSKVPKSLKYEMVDNVKYSIDLIDEDNGIINIQGWFYEVDEELTYVNRNVVLLDTHNNLYKMNTYMSRREDLEEYPRYIYSGFGARVRTSSLNSEEVYKMGFLYTTQEGEIKLYMTDMELR